MMRSCELTESDLADCVDLIADEETSMRFDQLFSNAYKETDEVQFRFLVPDGTLKSSDMHDYTDIVFENDGIKYNIYGANFGAHGVYLMADLNDTENLDYQAIDENNRAFAEKLVLSVDGKEYRPNMGQVFAWCDEKGESVLMEKGKWYTDFDFEDVEYEDAERVTISDGTNTFDLK